MWMWNWELFCGPGGLIIWLPQTKDLGLCFQEICLDVPVLILLAAISAYYVGFKQNFRHHLTKQQHIQMLSSLVLALLPFIRICYFWTVGIPPLPVDWICLCVEAVTWLIHLASIRVMNPSLVMAVFFTISYSLTGISVRSSLLQLGLKGAIWKILRFLLQTCYALSLLITNPLPKTNEQQALLNTARVNSYSRFRADEDPHYLGVGKENCNIISRLFFFWVGRMIQKGNDGHIQVPDDLFDLPLTLKPSHLAAKIRNTLSGPNISLLKALHKCFGIKFYSIGLLKLLSDGFGFAGPILLNLLVTFIENGPSDHISDGYLYAVGLLLSTLGTALCNSHFNFCMAEVGMEMRASLITTIYQKTLMSKSVSLSSFTSGEIVNFMSTDTDRIVNSCPSFHAFWSIPFQIAITLYLLYQQVGISFLAGLIVTVLLIPVNKLLANKIGSMSTQLMTNKDKRVQLISEALGGIRVLKLMVWERHFLNYIDKIRSDEIKYLQGRKYLDALCVFFWATTPVLISILTFVTFVLLGHQLTAATVFTSIALLNMLIAPLNAFPWVLNGLTEAWVSLKRLQKLLEIPDLLLSEYYSKMPPEEKYLALSLKNASFSWGGTLSVLKSISLDVAKGQLVGVTGQVGTGKSSLLSALVADLELQSGLLSVDSPEDGFGFVTQQPWLQRGTVRENILFGKPFDAVIYNSVIDACCLQEDFNSLPGGDLTGVGEGGATLSGGQKARLALARAVYQNKSIYLLDDILAAVDTSVARHIFQRTIMGLMANKTRILCTHHFKYLMHADIVVILEACGRIAKIGKPKEVLQDCDEWDSSVDFEVTIEQTVHPEQESVSNDSNSIRGSILAEEGREVGAVAWNVYSRYCKAMGYFVAFGILVSLIAMQATRNLTDWWLSCWVTNSANATNNTSDMNFYLMVYSSLVGLNLIFTLLRAFIFAYGGVQAAIYIHKHLLTRIIKAKVFFFDITPLGRILNRFSSDIYTVDDTLPFIINILLAQVFSLLGTIIITVYGLPWIIVILAPLMPIYYWLQRVYRLTARELKRLSSVTLSPIYSHFGESLKGLSTIRALRASKRFLYENEHHLEINQRCQFASQAAAQWLGLRLQLIGVALVTGVGIIAVLQHQLDAADPGLIGLALSYALSITGILSGVVNAFTETEREMVAVERVGQYIDEVEIEPEDDILLPPFGWPSQGVVEFRNVELRYREHLPPSLKRVTFETRPAEKLGVMGRTGAGKSSLLAALFRMTEVTKGEIIVDTVNISHINLQTLRSRLAIIPQDPFLFSGTVRENLDPCSQYGDSECNSALQRCHLAGVVQGLGGLDGEVGIGGRNLSTGQRQLLCLARAVLHNAKILCIDEATANVDHETDCAIQNTLRNSFRHSTVISIAHRVQTIIDFNRVLVMNNGEIVELDSPSVLMKDKTSYFYQLAGTEFQLE